MNEYRQHPSKVTRWDGEGLVPVVGEIEQLQMVWVALPPENGQQLWEGLNALPISEGVVELSSIPVFAHEMNFGDRVSTMKSAEGPLVCTGIIQRSDQWTYRVWLSDDVPGALHLVAEGYARAGCLVDVMSRRLIAFSCGRDLAEVVASKLASDERAGLLTYETGRL